MNSRGFLTRLWNLDNDERPGFLIGYTGPRLKGGTPVRSALFSTEGKDTVRERLLDPDKFLAAQIEEIDGQMAFRGDLVPALCRRSASSPSLQRSGAKSFGGRTIFLPSGRCGRGSAPGL